MESAHWLVVVIALIALAFGVVIWRAWDPKRRSELDRTARYPLDDVGESDVDD